MGEKKASGQQEPGVHSEMLTEVLEWQRTMLPTMRRMLVGLTTFFLLVTVIQLGYLHWKIGSQHNLDLGEAVIATSADADVVYQERALMALELAALQRRYNQAGVLLMSRVWMRYLGFLAGVIMAIVGAVFILGKLQIPFSEVGATVTDWTLNVRALLRESSWRDGVPVSIRLTWSDPPSKPDLLRSETNFKMWFVGRLRVKGSVSA